jgi:hypothetical protein
LKKVYENCFLEKNEEQDGKFLRVLESLFGIGIW